MIIDFPINCTTEASKWSFITKLNEKLRIWHNNNCKDMPANQAESWRKVNFYAKLATVMAARNEQINISRIGSHWNPKIPDHVLNGVIKYPLGLNQNNEGSRAAFLFGLMKTLQNREPDDIDVQAVQNALGQVKKDAINGDFWNPTIEDIADGF